jgi:hypothetical protein
VNFASRYGVIAGVLGLLAFPVFAQDRAGARWEIDLDGKVPPEVIQVWGGGHRVLYWDEKERAWIELYHGSTVIGLVDDPKSFFKRIVSDGRQWQWRNVGFVPLVAEPAVAAGQASEEDFAAAIAPLIGDLAEAPENSSANILYLFKRKNGPEVRAVRLASTVLCSEGGSVCPLVVQREDQPPLAVSFSLDAPWGFNEVGGRLYVEYQKDNELVQVDVVTGTTQNLGVIAPKKAEGQIREPRRYDE